MALAMDKFPEKISAGVFLTAFMPDTAHQPSFVLEQVLPLSPLLKQTNPGNFLYINSSLLLLRLLAPLSISTRHTSNFFVFLRSLEIGI